MVYRVYRVYRVWGLGVEGLGFRVEVEGLGPGLGGLELLGFRSDRTTRSNPFRAQRKAVQMQARLIRYTHLGRSRNLRMMFYTLNPQSLSRSNLQIAC